MPLSFETHESPTIFIQMCNISTKQITLDTVQRVHVQDEHEPKESLYLIQTRVIIVHWNPKNMFITWNTLIINRN